MALLLWKKSELVDMAQQIEREEYLIETNEGTYGPAEIQRAGTVGGMSDYRVYETVHGKRRVVGCDPARAPGRARRVDGGVLADRRREASRLRALAAEIRS